MAEDKGKKKSPTGPKVSPARTVISLIVLLIVGVICVIELRAGLGQMWSGKALEASSKDGEFSDLTLEEARGLLSMAPSETVEDRGPDKAHRFEWYSLLRPLMGQKSPWIMIIATDEEKPMALAFTNEEEVVVEEVTDNAPPAPTPNMGPGGGGGMGMGGGGGMGMGMGPGGGPGGPGGGPGGPGGGPGGGRQRPALEGEDDSVTSASPGEPAETPAAEESTEPSKTPDEKTPDEETPVPDATPEPAATPENE